MTRQTKLKLRKGFVNAPLVYRVVAADLLKPQDKKFVAKVLVKVNTERQAMALVQKGGKWGYKKEVALNTPRIGIITYKGSEVALMFKRVTTIVEPSPTDPVPEGALENEDDVWIRYDTFGLSIRQQHKHIRSEIDSQEKEQRILQIELDALTKVNDSLTQQVKSLQTQLSDKKKGKKK